MYKIRTRPFLLILLTISLGLLSRMIPLIPLCIGDALYAVMIFYIIKFLTPNQSLVNVILLSLLICFSIEESQLITCDILNTIRSYPLGRLVLGQGFLWSDIIAYTAGILTIGIVELKTSRDLSMENNLISTIFKRRKQ